MYKYDLSNHFIEQYRLRVKSLPIKEMKDIVHIEIGLGHPSTKTERQQVAETLNSEIHKRNILKNDKEYFHYVTFNSNVYLIGLHPYSDKKPQLITILPIESKEQVIRRKNKEAIKTNRFHMIKLPS